MPLTYDVAVDRGHYRDSVMEIWGLSGFSNYLKDCSTGHNRYKANEEGEKEKGIS
jgi:hypothetical protein